jgi:hypothetical protein
VYIGRNHSVLHSTVYIGRNHIAQHNATYTGRNHTAEHSVNRQDHTAEHSVNRQESYCTAQHSVHSRILHSTVYIGRNHTAQHSVLKIIREMSIIPITMKITSVIPSWSCAHCISIDRVVHISRMYSIILPNYTASYQ